MTIKKTHYVTITDEQDSEIRKLCFEKGITYHEARDMYFKGSLGRWL